MQFTKKIVGVILLSGLLFGCKKDDNLTTLPPPVLASVETAKFDAAIAKDWMVVIREIVKTEGKNPPQASRIYGYTGVTLYESVVNGIPENRSLAGQLNGLNKLPLFAGPVDYPAVANEALYNVSKEIFGVLKPVNLTRLDSIHTVNLTSRKTGNEQVTIDNSVEYGKQIATAMLTWISTDNFKETRTMTYVVPSRVGNPQFWAPTDAVNLNPAEPFWGQLRCFSMTSADMCEAPGLVPFSTVPGSAFYNQAMEVFTVNQNLTQGQKDIAKWWADGPSVTATPSGHWVGIENDLTVNLRLNLATAAAMYSMVGIVEADAFISCWYSKYKYNLLRPATYIREFIAGNATWSSLLPTPSFPEYPSGHSVSSGASSEVLTSMLGNLSFTDRTNTYFGFTPRFYTSFYEAADEAALSRLYGGIHYREANETGIKQGRAIAQFLLRRVHLKK